jgi:hypothetical protein
MNRYTTLVLMFSVAVITWIQPVWAQAQGAKATPPAPVEAFYCNLKEGKSMKDLMQVADRFSKWADKNDPSYAAWIITPQFGLGAQLPHLIWLGSWANGSEMGKGIAGYAADGRDLQDAFDGVIDCSMGHVLASSVEINAPDGPPGDGVVMFTECTIDDGSDWSKAVAAHKSFSGAMRSMGSKGSSWAFFPMLGGGDLAYDYLAVSTFGSWADYGAAYDMYVTGGGWQKAMETYKGVASCDKVPPTVWDVKLVHQGKPQA